jgi:DNA-binding beta-propeller fold protein YncE
MRHPGLLFALALAFSANASERACLEFLRAIPLPGVKGRFDHFAIDISGKRLFVAALGNNTLEVLDLGAGKRIQSISGMSKPTGVVYLPEGNQIWVANGDDGTLKILDGTTYRLIHTVASLPDADNLRLDPTTKLAWLGYGDGALVIVDPTATKLLARVKLPAHPESFQLEPRGPRLFVNVPDAKQVAVIDRGRRSVVATWPMETFQANFPMALDDTNHRLFLGCRTPPRLVVLDTSTGKPVTGLEISGDTDDLFYDAKRKQLYISCGEGFVDIIRQPEANQYARLERIPTAPGARTSLFSPDLDEFYLAVPHSEKHGAEIRVFRAQN